MSDTNATYLTVDPADYTPSKAPLTVTTYTKDEHAERLKMIERDWGTFGHVQFLLATIARLESTIEGWEKAYDKSVEHLERKIAQLEGK